MNSKLFAITKELIIERILKAIKQIRYKKAEDIADFADFISKRCKEQRLSEPIQQLISDSETLDFLKEEKNYILKKT